ncbi:MAG: nucleotide exchange factor GrpE [Oryzihumus sp.]
MTDQVPPASDAPQAPAQDGEAASAHQTTGSKDGTDQPRVDESTAEDIEPGLRARVAELEDRWRRTVADLDNMRKRFAREREQVREEERARAAADWLPILDNLELALQHAGADPVAIREGVQAVRDQAVDLMARLGFPQRDDTGAPFDPRRHEAVSTVVDASAKPGTVVHVVKPGYGDGPRQLRPASVIVAARGK